MVLNLTDNFKTLFSEDSSALDDFIENAHVHLLGCGTFESRVSPIRNFILPAFLAVYYKKGTVELHCNDGTTVLKPGSFFVFKPYEVYSGTLLEGDSYAFSFLQFGMTPFIQNFNLIKTAFALPEETFSSERYRRLGAALEDILSGSSLQTGRKALLSQLAKLIAAQILCDQLGRDGSPQLLKSSREARLINYAFQYVSDHLDEPISIGDIIRTGGTSKTSLERAFKNAFTLTPQQALLRFKIERSLEMLQSNIPEKIVAKELGFSSAYHFSNAFKAIMGIRPTEYKLRTDAPLRTDWGK